MNRGTGAGRGAFRPLGVEAGRRLLEALGEGAGDAAAVGRPGRRRGDGHRRRVAVAAFSISIGFLLPIAVPVRFMTASPGDERSPEMKKQAFAAVAASVGVAVGAVSAGALAQDAVQWRVEDGGNGHWYRVASLPETVYGEKIAFAASLSAQLASIESPSENGFIRSVGVSAGIPCRLVVGGTRSCSSCVWTWNDGARWGYENWGSSEPNTPGQAHIEMFIGFGAVGQWADVADSDGSCPTFLLEWSADCNADGIVDFGQILAGELPDANGNNIPDCCEGGVACDPCAAADLIANGQIDGVDLALLISAWGTDGGKFPEADIDRDGIVTGSDLALLLSYWGPCE